SRRQAACGGEQACEARPRCRAESDPVPLDGRCADAAFGEIRTRRLAARRAQRIAEVGLRHLVQLDQRLALLPPLRTGSCARQCHTRTARENLDGLGELDLVDAHEEREYRAARAAAKAMEQAALVADGE